MRPRLDVLPAAQLALWPELRAVPRRYVLYGGTAIALRLAHRASVDFDFFAHDALDHRELEMHLPFMREATTVQSGPSERSVLVPRQGATVKVSFFGGIDFGRLGEPEATDDGVLRAASLLDLGATKLKVLVQRVEAKDYVDVDMLLEHGLPLARLLGGARTLFGPSFNPLVAQKALAFFEGGDLAALPPAVRQRLTVQALRDIDAEGVPRASNRLD